MKKTAIVTGARRGIGLAIAKKLLEGGYRVVLCATTAAGEVTTLLEELNRLGEAYYLRCDISRPEDRDNLLDQVLERFGRLDVLVNNAGVACKQRLSILETTPESFERLMKVNCEGTFFLCQGGANRMIACQRQNLEDYHPRIVNISSISAYTSSTNRGGVLHLQGGHLHDYPALRRRAGQLRHPRVRGAAGHHRHGHDRPGPREV